MVMGGFHSVFFPSFLPGTPSRNVSNYRGCHFAKSIRVERSSIDGYQAVRVMINTAADVQ